MGTIRNIGIVLNRRTRRRVHAFVTNATIRTEEHRTPTMTWRQAEAYPAVRVTLSAATCLNRTFFARTKIRGARDRRVLCRGNVVDLSNECRLVGIRGIISVTMSIRRCQ